MAVRLRRDDQRWVYNYVLQESGRVMHFQGGGRGRLPGSVHQHDMVKKHYAKSAARVALVASEEEAAGHAHTALELYFDAAALYAQAQHPILENNAEKSFLHAQSLNCYGHVRRLAPYRIEHVEIPWEEGTVFANLHLLPNSGPTPCVVFIPGCDQTKEMYPHPTCNHAHQRGMHVLALDGPGQGECNLNGVKLTDSNYEVAVSAVVDYLLTRPEVDPDAITILGVSFGSYWAIRSALDPRVRAVAAPWASICDKRHLMDEESPRFKMLFSYLTQSSSEEELDEITGRMTTHEQLRRITCPTLLTVGEFDPRSPLEEVLELYELMSCERELWVFEDQHHSNSIAGHMVGADTMLWNTDMYMAALDWLVDRVHAKAVRHSGEVVYLPAGKGGPNGQTCRIGGTWLDQLDPSIGTPDQLGSR